MASTLTAGPVKARLRPLYAATGALIGGTLVCGLARGFWMYAAGLSVWGGVLRLLRRDV